LARRGVALVVAGPSGVGKGALIARLREAHPEVFESVSVTTRAPRPGEVEGKDYDFVPVAEFERLRDANELLEWASIHGSYFYGTPVAGVREKLAAGTDVVFEVDYQGAESIRRALGADTALVFVLPPSLEELQRRQHCRHTETPEQIAARLRSAQVELAHTGSFDYLVLNDDLAQASRQLVAILEAERARRERAGLEGLVGGLEEALTP